MHTYPMNTTQAEIDAVVAKMTAKGTETMKAIGMGQTSFFDEGITEWSGIWGECLTAELGHKSSGVINRLRDLGVLRHSPSDEDPSGWWDLTALGADVANFLAGNLEGQQAEEAPAEEMTLDELADAIEKVQAEEPVEAGVGSVKKGAKWTYLYATDGTLIAELRNDQFEAIAAFLK